MIKKIILGYFFFCCSFTIAMAAPIINNVSGVVTHKGTINLTGEQFGSKIPAAPLIWDDCEDKTVDSDAAVINVWSEVHPHNSGLSYPYPTFARTRYRTIPYRSLPAPHQYSKQYLSGGHYQYANNSPAYIGSSEGFRDVLVTIDAGSVKENWFATWYYRLDLNWRTPVPPSNNHKFCVSNGGATAWSSPMAYDAVGSQAPSASGDNVKIRTINGGCGEVGAATDNPRDDWIRYERRQESLSGGGFRKTLINNIVSNDVDGCGEWTSTRSFSIGGYYRWATDIDDIATYRGSSDGTDLNPENNSFRFFDDMYVDTTFSRVMLGNNSNYDNCTITEPQIPSAWSSTEITVIVNLGKLPASGTVYMFVFDDQNNHNSIGYELNIAGRGIPYILLLLTPPMFQEDE